LLLIGMFDRPSFSLRFHFELTVFRFPNWSALELLLYFCAICLPNFKFFKLYSMLYTLPTSYIYKKRVDISQLSFCRSIIMLGHNARWVSSLGWAENWICFLQPKHKQHGARNLKEGFFVIIPYRNTLL